MPGTTGLAANITIKNGNDAGIVLFRVQTTSPLSYRVKPSHGRVDAKQSIDVHVSLAVEPPAPDPTAPGTKKVDKFLVKWVYLDAEQTANLPADLSDSFNDVFLLGGKPAECRLKCILPDTVPASVNRSDSAEIQGGNDKPNLTFLSSANQSVTDVADAEQKSEENVSNISLSNASNISNTSNVSNVSKGEHSDAIASINDNKKLKAENEDLKGRVKVLLNEVSLLIIK